jgi:hypothetical protein
MAGHFIYIRGAPRSILEFHNGRIKRQIAPLEARFMDFIAMRCDEVVGFLSSPPSDFGIIIEKNTTQLRYIIADALWSS